MSLPPAKTARGLAELAGRELGLSLRQRRLLILVDGERDLAALTLLLPGDPVPALLEELTRLGLIECPVLPVATVATAPTLSGAPPVPEPAPTAAPTLTTRPAPPPLEPGRLARAQALMRDSTTRLLGVLGAPLQRQIEAIKDADGLRAVVARWNMALRESRMGAQEADRLLAEVRGLL